MSNKTKKLILSVFLVLGVIGVFASSNLFSDKIEFGADDYPEWSPTNTTGNKSE